MARKTVVIGTRKSQLALTQSHMVRDILQGLYPEHEFVIEGMTTTGDLIVDKALSKVGEKALFTKELEVALEQRKVDIVIHCLKDLPTVLPPGMQLGAIMEREDPRDALILNKKNQGKNFETLAAGSVIGTGSLRRVAQLKRKYPHLEFANVRGNLDTRLAKLDDENGPFSGIVLAVAGLVRLNLDDRISHKLSSSESLYAVSQGALGIECREGDEDILALLKPLDHEHTRISCLAERALMRTLEGGCSVPVGVNTKLDGNTLWLHGLVASLDGKHVVEYQDQVRFEDGDTRQSIEESAEKLGNSVANKLLENGANAILSSLGHN